MRSRCLLALLVALLAGAAPAAGTIASDGFDRPERLDVIEAGADARVAIATGDAGPAAVWEDGDGLLLRPLGEPAPEARLLDSNGVRDVAAGAAGGDPVVAWSERDLATGRNRLAWRWRDETRTVLETGQPPLVRVVAGGERPEILVARPGARGWRLSLHAWDGTVREAAPRALTVAGIDAVRGEGGVTLGWLEGSTEVVLGRAEADWTAYLATWPDGADAPTAPRELGPALRAGSGDAVRLGSVGGEVHALWPGPDGGLRATGPGGAREGLGDGSPLGRAEEAWLWASGDELMRLADDDEAPRRVLRLPAAPERIAAAAAGDVTAVAWSSGRYRGGLEVWAVTDGVAYAPTPIERFAVAMGWDPWRPWSAAAGHLLVSLLAAVLIAASLTPLWWAGTALLGRRHDVTAGTAALEGAAVAVGSLVLLLAAIAGRAQLDPAQVRALLGGPGTVAAASAAGLAVAWLAGRRRDAEPAFGRLVAAWLAGGTMLFVLAFVTAQAWLDTFAAVA